MEYLPNDITAFAEMVSLVLTAPTLLGAIAVLWVWGGRSWEIFKKSPLARAEAEWLILGIAVGFLGGLVDNVYWGIAWSYQLLDSPDADWWWSHGAYSNIFARQLAGAYAAYCHVTGFVISVRSGHYKLALAFAGAIALGFLYVACLLAMRSLAIAG